MADYLLVESQGGWLGPGTEAFLRDAVSVAERGDRVWLLLIENGVTGALPGHWPELATLTGLGTCVWVDGYSLEERGFDPAVVAGAVTVVDMDTVAGKLLEPGVRVVWH